MVFALWHELDAVPRQGPKNLVPDVIANVAMSLLWSDLGHAADLEAVNSSRRDASRLCELNHSQFSQGAGCGQLPTVEYIRGHDLIPQGETRNLALARDTS